MKETTTVVIDENDKRLAIGSLWRFSTTATISLLKHGASNIRVINQDGSIESDRLFEEAVVTIRIGDLASLLVAAGYLDRP